MAVLILEQLTCVAVSRLQVFYRNISLLKSGKYIKFCYYLMVREILILALISDDSVIALANRCPHLRSLGLYFCKNITDNAMYSLAQSKVKNRMWGAVKGGNEEDGLRNLNISQCTSLTPSAVQAVCDSSPALHTCSGRHSLIMSGCLNLTSVHCACAIHAHRGIKTFPHTAH